MNMYFLINTIYDDSLLVHFGPQGHEIYAVKDNVAYLLNYVNVSNICLELAAEDIRNQ